MSIFTRASSNPILIPRDLWWESRGVFNPGVIAWGEKDVVMVYRAVGSDGISRFGLATSRDGIGFDRRDYPLYEASYGDWAGRLGVEDSRLTVVEDVLYITFTKVSLEVATHPRLSWETAPFRLRSWLARFPDLKCVEEVGPVLSERNTKDLVLFPERIEGSFVALIREYPSIQLVTSTDLRSWTDPQTVLQPIPGTWEAERVGAGPPPLRWGRNWLMLYHANAYLRFPGNERLYRMGLAVLDGVDPSRVLYRHPESIFEPEAPYEIQGPVGSVVFGTALIDRGELFRLYYGAADGVIGVADVSADALNALLPTTLRR